MMRRGGRWLAFAALAVALLAPASSFAQGICNRTQAVQDAIRDVFVEAFPDESFRILNTPCRDVSNNLLGQILALDLSDEGLTSLRAGDFAGLSNLEWIFLENNDLSTLPSGLFGGLTSLNYIGLSNNSLSSLPSGLFSGLGKLALLDVTNNNLSSLPSRVFRGLDNLLLLDLDDNNLSSLPSGVFDDLTSLLVLSLDNNRLSSLSPGVFSDLTSLIGITLNNNQFSSLPARIFSGLPLQVVHLHANQFQRLPAGLFTDMAGTGLNTVRADDLLDELGIEGEFEEDIYLGLRFESNPKDAPREHSFSVSLEVSESPRQAVVRIAEGVPSLTRLTLTINGVRQEINLPVGAAHTPSYSLPNTQRVAVVLEEGTIGARSIVRDFTGVDFRVARQVVRLGPDYPVSITASETSVREGREATFTLTTDAAVSFEDLEVTVEVSGNGMRTSARGTWQVTIPAGSRTTMFDVATRTNDQLYSGDQTMTVTVRSGNGAAAETPSSARVTVREDETRPTGVELSVSPEVVNEDAGATIVTVTAGVMGGHPLANATQVTATLSKTGRSGVATNPAQHLIIPIGAGSTRGGATFTVTPTVDRGVFGGDGTLTVSGTHSLLPVSAATVLVRDTQEATVSVRGGTGLTSQPESRPDRDRFSAAEGASVALTAASTGLPVSATFAWSQLSDDPVQLPLSRSARNRAVLPLTLPDRSSAYTVHFNMIATHDPGGGAHVRTYTRQVALAVSATDADPVISEAVSEVEGVSEAGEIRVLVGTEVVLRGRASDADTDQSLAIAWSGAEEVILSPVGVGQCASSDRCEAEEVMFTAPAAPGRYPFTFEADDDGRGGDRAVTRAVVVEVVSGRGVSIRPVSSRVFEDEMEGATFELRASMASTTPLVVNVTLSEEGGMFELEGGAQTVTIAANETAKRFTVPIADDDRQQRNGALRATVGAGTGYLAVAPSRARVRILDDESLVDVNADGAVNANDALILFYAWTLRSDLGSGR